MPVEPDTNGIYARVARWRFVAVKSGDYERLGDFVLRWFLPGLFAVIVSATIRFHSLAPGPTMGRTVGNLLALAGIALVTLLAQGRTLRMSLRTALLLLALVVSSIVSVLGSGGIDHSFLRLELYLSVGLIALVTYVAYRDRDELPLEAFFLAIAICHIPFLVAAVMWVRDLTPPYWADGLRLAHFAHVRQYGEFGFLAALCASAAGLYAGRFAVLSFLLASAALFGVILTGSRGAVLSWVSFIILMCWLSRAKLRAAVHGALVLLASGAGVWYLHVSGQFPSPNIFVRAASFLQGEESFDSSRLELWRQSVEQIFARPVFGSGPEGYWLSGCCNRSILQAHNFVLQFLIEFGFFGCGIAILLLAQVVKRLGGVAGVIGRAMATPANRVQTCMLGAFIAYSLIDQMMYHLLPLLHLALLLGLFSAGLVRVPIASQAGTTLDRSGTPPRRD